MHEIEITFTVLRVWGGIGAAVAVLFLTIGMDRIDEDAQGAYIFRPLLIPGILVIWPFVLWRWFVYESGREVWSRRYAPPRKAHFAVGLIMPVAIAIVIGLGWTVRQQWPAEIEPVRLSPPAQVTQ